MDPGRELAVVDHGAPMSSETQESGAPSAPVSIATISSGFEKGDFLVREEKGQRV